MFGLALRHNSLHHLFALFLTLALATLCWCCWRRGRSYHRRRELLPSRATAPTPTAPSSSPSYSSAPPTLTPTRLDPHIAVLLPVLSYHAPTKSHTGEFSSPHTDDSHHACSGDDDDSGPNCYGGSDFVIKNSDCAICLSSFDSGTLVTVLPSCSHAYHPSCITQWVQSHKDCPVCRTEISLPAL
ncbi:hypothetical protein GOP47_0024886 [Adiantum capillus-veneris]|uniref:RING-type domain-containing protein n=1 Tax=Adiantum capillus-veneris TaxID=13818 RepID=A0A9D4U589_ADICA|nr:hypothetical protein GOP47_0024886 [Adiantum capillus-veneris]